MRHLPEVPEDRLRHRVFMEGRRGPGDDVPEHWEKFPPGHRREISGRLENSIPEIWVPRKTHRQFRRTVALPKIMRRGQRQLPELQRLDAHRLHVYDVVHVLHHPFDDEERFLGDEQP